MRKDSGVGRLGNERDRADPRCDAGREPVGEVGESLDAGGGERGGDGRESGRDGGGGRGGGEGGRQRVKLGGEGLTGVLEGVLDGAEGRPESLEA